MKCLVGIEIRESKAVRVVDVSIGSSAVPRAGSVLCDDLSFGLVRPLELYEQRIKLRPVFRSESELAVRAREDVLL